MQAFTDTYCTCQTSDARSKHVIETHVKDILTNTLQPVFQRQAKIHPTLSKLPEPKYRASHESELHENQQWKAENYTDILYWIVKDISVSKYCNVSLLLLLILPLLE